MTVKAYIFDRPPEKGASQDPNGQDLPHELTRGSWKLEREVDLTQGQSPGLIPVEDVLQAFKQGKPHVWHLLRPQG
jgi:hypothetical protein